MASSVCFIVRSSMLNILMCIAMQIRRSNDYCSNALSACIISMQIGSVVWEE